MIEMNPFKKEPDELKEEIIRECKAVINSGWYILGEKVSQFENEWANACGVKYGVGVASGLDGLEIGLRALGIGNGDEVITTSMTAFATVLAIVRVGAKPVFADINEESALIKTEKIENLINIKTKAIILVHLYGQVCDVDSWSKICKQNKIFLIEDCAQSHLAKYNNQFVGSFGVFSSFSFYPTKNLGAIGDAGMLLSDNLAIAEFTKSYRNYGQVSRYNNEMIGSNSRLDEMQAAILTVKNKWLKKFIDKRKVVANHYNSEISNSLIKKLNTPKNKDSHVYHLYVVNCEKRDEFQQYLLDNNIQSLIHYPVPCHQQKAMQSIDFSFYNLDNTEKHSKSCVSLPCNPTITENEVAYIIEKINKFGE
mgnify:CR=1 FL=1